MKTLTFLLAGTIGALLTTTGCTTYYCDAGADYLERQESVSRSPYYTEFEVSQNRISGQGESSVLLWIFQFSDGKYCLRNRNPRLSLANQVLEFLSPTQKAVGNAKNSALYNACESAPADQLLGTAFEYKITNYLFYSTVECNVKGFPATVKGVKMLEKQPVILNNWQKIEYLAPYEIPQVYSDPDHATPPSALVKHQ